MTITHIECIKANEGKRVAGLEDGHLCKVIRETEKFFFAVTHTGQQLKISKVTKRDCGYSSQAKAPEFNI